MSSKHIPLTVIADWFEIDKTGVKRYLKKAGIDIDLVRDHLTRQKVLAVKEPDAYKAYELRKSDGFKVKYLSGELPPNDTEEFDIEIERVKSRAELFTDPDDDLGICRFLNSYCDFCDDPIDRLHLKDAEAHIHGQRVLIDEALKLIDQMRERLS